MSIEVLDIEFVFLAKEEFIKGIFSFERIYKMNKLPYNIRMYR